MAIGVKAVYNAEIVPGGFLYDQAFSDIATDVTALSTQSAVLGKGVNDVGSSDSDGTTTGTTASAVDHIHRGVHKINLNADAFGDIVFTGAGVSQSSNTFNFLAGTYPVRVVSASFTFGSTDGTIAYTGATPITGTLPTAASAGNGKTYLLFDPTAEGVTLASSGGDTLVTVRMNVAVGATSFGQFYLLVSDGTSKWYVLWLGAS